jgi:ribonuclease HI
MLHLVSKHFSGGWGFVITNEIGEAVAAAAGHIENVSNPLKAEAMACCQALTFAA